MNQIQNAILGILQTGLKSISKDSLTEKFIEDGAIEALDNLVVQGLMEAINDNTYHITPKGKEYIDNAVLPVIHGGEV